MDALVVGLSSLVEVLRTGLNILLAIAVVLATLAWAVRSRRLSPFGALARFARSSIDPLIAPIERHVIRAGGTGVTAPWWTLLVLFLVCVGVVFTLLFVRDTLQGVGQAASRGPRGLAALAIAWTFGLVRLALLARVIMSWIGGGSSWIGRLATRLTEWCLAPLRRVLPPIGGIDASPIIAWVLLGLLQAVILRVL